MKYVSIDTETTGLDPNRHQILQIAAVIDDLENPKPIDELPRFVRYFHYEELVGNPYALQMNGWIMKRACEIKRNGKNVTPTYSNIPRWEHKGDVLTVKEALSGDFHKFLSEHYWNDDRYAKDGKWINVGGKNFGNFDAPFIIANFPKLENVIKWRSRILDVGPMFLKATDKCVPDLKTCLERAGIEKEVTHDACDDALDVIKCVRAYYNINVPTNIALDTMEV